MTYPFVIFVSGLQIYINEITFTLWTTFILIYFLKLTEMIQESRLSFDEIKSLKSFPTSLFKAILAKKLVSYLVLLPSLTILVVQFQSATYSQILETLGYAYYLVPILVIIELQSVRRTAKAAIFAKINQIISVMTIVDIVVIYILQIVVTIILEKKFGEASTLRPIIATTICLTYLAYFLISEENSKSIISYTFKKIIFSPKKAIPPLLAMTILFLAIRMSIDPSFRIRESDWLLTKIGIGDRARLLSRAEKDEDLEEFDVKKLSAPHFFFQEEKIIKIISMNMDRAKTWNTNFHFMILNFKKQTGTSYLIGVT